MNIPFKRKMFWIPSALLVAAFILSLLFYHLREDPFTRRVLFFPHDMSRQIKGETRYLPLYDKKEDNIRIVVRELLLGPETLVYNRTVPKGTKLKTMILKGDRIFLDFSIDMVLGNGNGVLHFDEVIKIIKKTLLFNFKHLRTVNITIDGQVPYAPYYEESHES